MTIRILTVEDHPLMRAGIVAMLETETDLRVVAEAGSAAESLAAFRHHRPDITLMDLRLADRSGVDAIRLLREEFRHARIIVLTTYRGDATARAALDAGASGYLLKSTLRNELVAAIRHVAAGGRHVCAEVSAELVQRIGEETLTRRETHILQQLCGGLDNRHIAAELAISTETVKAHLAHVFAKLGARSRTEAMAIALRRGLVSLAPDGVVPPRLG